MVLRQIGQVFRMYGEPVKSEGDGKTGKGVGAKPGLGRTPQSILRPGLTLARRMSPITKPSGAILPKPENTRFGLLSIVCSIVIGIFIGSNISKMVANFLEEKELFIPSDDDDDDD